MKKSIVAIRVRERNTTVRLVSLSRGGSLRMVFFFAFCLVGGSGVGSCFSSFSIFIEQPPAKSYNLIPILAKIRIEKKMSGVK